MDLSAAVSKAARLLRLAKSDNPHEAALAAARAQEIIDRYKLSGQDLELDGKREAEPEEPIRDFEAPLDGEGRSTWRRRLAFSVCRANQCQAYHEGATGALRLVGRPSDAEAVRYLYAFLVREIDRLATRDAVGNGRTWANNYRLGCVTEIGKRLHEQKASTVSAVKSEAANPHALVLVEQAIVRVEQRAEQVETWVESNLKLRSIRSRSTYHDGAREAGRKAAREINLGAKGRMVAGHKALSGGES